MRRVLVSCCAFTALAFITLSFAKIAEADVPGVEASTFLVPAHDGYGVGDCLAGQNECGQVVADAWCRTHGFRRASTFGVSNPEDVTGSVQVPVRQARALAITCE